MPTIMIRFKDIEEDLQSETTGYLREKSDRYWIIVTATSKKSFKEGYRLAIMCHHWDKGYTWTEGYLDDAVVIFTSYKKAKAYVNEMPRSLLTGPMNLGDYWRIGDVTPKPCKFKASEKILHAIDAFHAS